MADAKYGKLAEALIDRESGLRADRSNLEALWQDVANYVIPRKATFTEEVTPGSERARSVLDSTAPRALEMFASFLHTLSNNPAVQWFLVEPEGPGAEDALKSPDVQKWCEDTAKRMKRRMEGPKCNVYSTLHEGNLDIGAFGTDINFTEMAGADLRIRSFHLQDVVIDEDAYGFVDTALRKACYTERQAQQLFPEWEVGKKQKKVDFLHATFPTTDPEYADLLPARVRNAGAPFASIWVDKDKKSVVRSGTFEDMPYSVARWYRERSSMYGVAPAMTVMPDVRMVNRMSDTILRGAEKLVDPPMAIPEGGLVSPVRMFPGGLTFTEGNWDPKPLIPPGASRIEVGDNLLTKRQDAIERGFFVPLFASPDSPVKTATEVLQVRDERNRAVAPMVTRLQNERYHTMLKRVFRLMYRAGELAPMPAAMQGLGVGIRYVSPLSASQHEMESLGTLRIIEALLPWAQIAPGVLDIFDPDEVAKVVHLGSGAPSKVLRSKSALEQFRKIKLEAQQRAEQNQNLLASADAQAKLVTANAKAA